MKPNIGFSLLRISVVYLVAGLMMGLAIGITKSFYLASAHSHLLLLGWATMAITGVVYLVLPECAGTRLASAHFWLLNLGLPVMVVSLVFEAFGRKDVEPAIAAGSVMTLASLLSFAVNLWMRGKPAQTEAKEG